MCPVQRSFVLAIPLLLMLAACSAPRPTAPPTPTPAPPPTPTPTLTPAMDDGLVLLEERTVGAYTVRLWQPAPGTGLYNHAMLSAPGQAELRVESVAALGELPRPDVTGEGYPDVWFETAFGGHRCCAGTVLYNLGNIAAKVLEITSAADYYGTGGGRFQDLDGDGSYEFITLDPLSGIPCTAPSVKVVLRYLPGQGYVGAGPYFPSAYADNIAAYTQRAEEQRELSRDGYKCGVYDLIVTYLYAGQPERAWQELQRLYLGPDLAQFYTQLQQAVSAGRFFVAPPAP